MKKLPNRLQLTLPHDDAVLMSKAAALQDIDLPTWARSRLRKAARAELNLPQNETPIEPDVPAFLQRGGNGLQSALNVALGESAPKHIARARYEMDDLLAFLRQRGVAEQQLKDEVWFLEDCVKLGKPMETVFVEIQER